MNKEYYKNTVDDLKEFKSVCEEDLNKANNIAADEWNTISPKNEKEFEEYYENSKSYIDAMAVYNTTGKKLRLFSKINKVIESLGDVKTIVDFGCGVGSDSLEFSSLGYDIIAIDLSSAALDFTKWRRRKYKMQFRILNTNGKIPQADLILSLDTLEHVYDPYKTIKRLIESKPKYLLLTTAFGVHETDEHTIPQHTDHNVHKLEKFIEENGYKKQKLAMPFPPRLFIKQ